MPGIVGIVSHRPAEECQSRVQAMIGSMQHESFYSSGTYFAPGLGVYSGWVALEDSFAARQVFCNDQRDVAFIISGECLLDESGDDPASRLLHLYEEEGERFFPKLNGLFSGLLIDQRERKALLFNDRYGFERIYWHENKEGIYFASEAKALLRILPELRAFDPEGLAQFLTFGCTLERRTLFQGISRLPGASLWGFAGGTCRKRQYFLPQTWESQPVLSPEAFNDSFQETFQRILPRYFQGESRIGVSLTAGLDSRMILACYPEDERPVCYTYSGRKQDILDARLAARLAKTCGLEHQILRIGEDFLSEFASHLDRTIYITDGYLGASGAHEIYFSQQARALAPVRLTGVFGGEILRELSMFKPLRLSERLVDAALDKSLNACARQRSHDDQHPVTFTAFREIPEKRFATPAACRSQLSFRTPYLDNELVALAYRVPASLQTSELPALALITKAKPRLSRIPTDMGEMGDRASRVIRRVFSKATFKLDYAYNEGLPHRLSRLEPFLRRLNSTPGIFGLHKFLHYRSWFQRELAPLVKERLAEAQTRQSGLWNAAFLAHVARDHVEGRRNYVHEIDAVLTLEAVERLLFKDLPRDAERAAIPVAATLVGSMNA